MSLPLSNALLSHPVPVGEQPFQSQDQTINTLVVPKKLITGGQRGVNIPVPFASGINGTVGTPDVIPVTAEQLLSGVVAIALLPYAPAGAITMPLPTAAAMVAAMQGQYGQMLNAAGGMSFEFDLVNPAAYTVTPVAAAGFTLSTGAAVAVPAGSAAAPTAASYRVVVTVPTAGTAACVLLRASN